MPELLNEKDASSKMLQDSITKLQLLNNSLPLPTIDEQVKEDKLSSSHSKKTKSWISQIYDSTDDQFQEAVRKDSNLNSPISIRTVNNSNTSNQLEEVDLEGTCYDNKNYDNKHYLLPEFYLKSTKTLILRSKLNPNLLVIPDNKKVKEKIEEDLV